MIQPGPWDSALFDTRTLRCKIHGFYSTLHDTPTFFLWFTVWYTDFVLLHYTFTCHVHPSWLASSYWFWKILTPHNIPTMLIRKISRFHDCTQCTVCTLYNRLFVKIYLTSTIGFLVLLSRTIIKPGCDRVHITVAKKFQSIHILKKIWGLKLTKPFAFENWGFFRPTAVTMGDSE